MRPTTFSIVAIGTVTSLWVRSFWKRVANSALGFICRYWWLNHFIFSGSKRAPALCTFFKSKSCTSCSTVKISLSVPGFQPKSAKKLISASGKYPSPLKPLRVSPFSVQSIGKTGKPNLIPSRLLSLPLPTGLRIRGKCAKAGACQPKAQ